MDVGNLGQKVSSPDWNLSQNVSNSHQSLTWNVWNSPWDLSWNIPNSRWNLNWNVWKPWKLQVLLATTQYPLKFFYLILPFWGIFCLSVCFSGPSKLCFLANEVSSSRGRRLWGRGSTRGIGWGTTRRRGISWSGRSQECWNSGSLGSPMYEISGFW